MALAHYALVSARARAQQGLAQYRRITRRDRLEHEIALLREELRIKDARLARIPASQRPHCQPSERLAVLELRASRGWSLVQTAKAFLVTATTIASWSNRLDEQGPEALLRTREPINKFPQFVRYIVQRLQTLCPRLGKVKIAQMLARAGLHLGVSTIGRMRRHSPRSAPPNAPKAVASAPHVTANYPNHVWHVDLTVVPTAAGFWTSWLPLALPQSWPFCWWLAVVLDDYSRRALGCAVFRRQPMSAQIRRFLGGVMARAGAAPKYLVSDSGTQFCCAAFERWCARHDIRHRRGAIGKRGSIAVLERFMRTLKDEGTRVLPVVPLALRSFQRDLSWFFCLVQREPASYDSWRRHARRNLLRAWARLSQATLRAATRLAACGSLRPTARPRQGTTRRQAQLGG